MATPTKKQVDEPADPVTEPIDKTEKLVYKPSEQRVVQQLVLVRRAAIGTLEAINKALELVGKKV